jgi:integrase
MSQDGRPPRPRRESVRNRPGIYYREGSRGRRYEITYVDSEGRRRWQVVPGGLKDAEAAREEVRRRLRRGERVAPSRQTVAEAAEAWLAARPQLAPRTVELYESVLRNHVVPALGRMRLGEVSEDHVAFLVADMTAAGYKAWTIRATLTPLRGIFNHAVRRGLATRNPVSGLERRERPTSDQREMRVLNRSEIQALLDAADERHRPLLATAVFTGCRFGELLGLVWADVSLAERVLRVRKQLGRDGVRREPKTPHAKRDIVLMPALVRLLTEHKLQSPFSGEGDFVFCGPSGRPLDQRNVAVRGLAPAVARAGLDSAGKPNVTMHGLRHTYASILVSLGHDLAFVSEMLGHADPSITLRVYTRLLDGKEQAARASQALEDGFGAMVDAR